MKLKKIIKYSTVVLVAVIIELLFFDFTNILNIISNYKLQMHEKTLFIEDAQLINWDVDEGIYVSKDDPIILFEGINSKINNFKIRVNSKQKFENIIVFYTKNNSGLAGEQYQISPVTLSNNEGDVKIDDDIYSLRIDLSENKGIKIRNFCIVLNPTKLDFSISRVLAMLVIYFLTGALFRLHKSPEYGIE